MTGRPISRASPARPNVSACARSVRAVVRAAVCSVRDALTVCAACAACAALTVCAVCDAIYASGADDTRCADAARGGDAGGAGDARGGAARAGGVGGACGTGDVRRAAGAIAEAATGLARPTLTNIEGFVANSL